MDKLISANAVITILENARFRAGKDLSKAYLIADLQEQMERLPAAFDKEKVVEELKEGLKLADKEKERCARENPLQFDSAKGYSNGIANAIEIVKKGGVD